MIRIVIQGESDDLVLVEGDIQGSAAYNVAHDLNAGRSAVFELLWGDADGEIRGNLIAAWYTKEGTWLIGVAPFAEDLPFAIERSEIRLSESGYSTRLEIVVPDGSIITYITDDADDASV